MRFSFLLLAAAIMLALPPVLPAQISRILTVEPDTAKAGDILTATGEAINKNNVDEMYLTDGAKDFKTSIVEQTDTSIKFKVPTTIKAGRYALMIRTRGNEPKLLEQPVKVTIE